MRLIQVTDSHLCADPEARGRIGMPLPQFLDVMNQVKRFRPDVLLVTGDVGHDESPAAYQHALDTFSSLECPWFWIPGNHDHQPLMAEYHEIHEDVDLDGWRMLALNTQVPGQPHGQLGESQLRSLASRLEDDARPTLLVMHHQPLEVGSAWIDSVALEDREALWQVLAAYPQVQAIFCGHIHQAFASQRHLEEGVIAVYGCPATSDQFLPGSDEFALDTASRPGFRVIDLYDTGLDTWVERVDQS
ncbi:metallophosphoesterase [Aidingimonas halophila]|uniref:Icc protein n=1 Tax=Aidingimonas halophila TaxID=574349 RepID=A0A1H2RLF2_9GAMM|nr:metallophosphoesterase [Aidingimonas halophila]GHC19107.1 3',5'-cyclic adenosine monophosphate phosphodiesterase CpdA [Aidingimonas halophila]SDW19594.1 Icc protein [Aidingimonas halophila]